MSRKHKQLNQNTQSKTKKLTNTNNIHFKGQTTKLNPTSNTTIQTQNKDL